MTRILFPLVLALQALAWTSPACRAETPCRRAALPKRLVLALDGVSYRDIQALQEGLIYKDSKGKQIFRQAFSQGYFTASRNISTFPSASDVAWTDIFGNRPLPGYQRTYFSEAINSQVAINGVTTSMEHERQMHWDLRDGFLRTMGYVHPRRIFHLELRDLVTDFLRTTNGTDTYYAYFRSTDDAQHMAADIFAMLCELDEKLEDLRARYEAQEGRDLEILILSDHGHNHAGRGQRVEVLSFLKNAGYRPRKSLVGPKDVVLPTTGMESWVEIHNRPADTEKLIGLLWHLKGVDIISAKAPDDANRFIVMSWKGERAIIEWHRASNAFRYSAESGDPLGYLAVVEELRRENQLDSDGFASADTWMSATMAHRYPLALERIARGHTDVTLNPATILISLKNGYVHCGWFVKKGSELVKIGGTHGALDDLDSDGVLLSNFAPTQDTSTHRVAALFGGFPGLRDFRAQESGAEWITGREQALTRIARAPLDRDCDSLPDGAVFLRVWTPAFTGKAHQATIEIAVEQPRHLSPMRDHWGRPQPPRVAEQRLTLSTPRSFPDQIAYEGMDDPSYEPPAEIPSASLLRLPFPREEGWGEGAVDSVRVQGLKARNYSGNSLTQFVSLRRPSSTDPRSCERLYAFPSELVLEPRKEYRISGWLRGRKNTRIFSFLFHTDGRGLPVAF